MPSPSPAARPRGGSMSIWLDRPIAIPSPGPERTGSGATSASCLTMMRKATTAWCERRCSRAHRSPPLTFIPFLPKVSARSGGVAYERELKSFYGAERLDRGSTALRCDTSRAGAGWAYSLVVPGHGRARRARPVGRRRCWRQVRSAHHADLSGTREQPARGLSGRGEGEAGDLRSASPRRRQPAGSASPPDRHSVPLWRCGSGGDHRVTMSLASNSGQAEAHGRRAGHRGGRGWDGPRTGQRIDGGIRGRGPGSAHRERLTRRRDPDLGDDGGVGAAARGAAHELCRASSYRCLPSTAPTRSSAKHSTLSRGWVVRYYVKRSWRPPAIG